MNYFLLKTEPDSYAFDDLVKERETDWTGVANPQAVRNLAGMKKGDGLVIYHTGKEKRAVGLAHVLSIDLSDPKQPLVRISAGHPIARPKTLAEIKQEPIFKDSPLLRQGRLSVAPLTKAQYDWISQK
jgi:predicted RNA-binding protein with PUA-like domain